MFKFKSIIRENIILKNNYGSAYVEFLIVIMPFLMLFFGLTQLGLIFAADLLVEHAASSAVRAAIVILPDDNEQASYAGVAINTVGTGGAGIDAYSAAPSGGRLDEIKKAARLTLAPISPSIESISSGSMADAIGNSVAISFLAGFLGWTQYAVAISFPDGNDGFKTKFKAKEPITVRVTYLYKCSIPFAKNIMCSNYLSLKSSQTKILKTNGNLAAGLSIITGSRVLVLEAERTLPNQGK